MNEIVQVSTERVDDIPVLLAQMRKLALAGQVDAHFPTHGHWQGLSLGQVLVGWLSHILSTGDHRMNHVQDWVARRLQTLRPELGPGLRSLDFADDRLAAVLDALSADTPWQALEASLNQSTLRVYPLTPERLHWDTTTLKHYGQVTADGLFQFGHSKDHRPDLPQVKVMLGALAPLGLPWAVDVVAGQCADDPLYVPAIQRVQASDPAAPPLLHVGDGKMGARGTRAYIYQSGDYYLVPLTDVQLPPPVLRQYIRAAARRALQPVRRTMADGTTRVIAYAYARQARVVGTYATTTSRWRERRVVTRSPQLLAAARRGLRQRLAKAQLALQALNQRGRGRRRFATILDLWHAVHPILDRYQVRPFMHLTYTLRDTPRAGRAPHTAAYLTRIAVCPQAVIAYLAQQGWRVYATCAPPDRLTVAQVVLAYREQYLAERACGRLKGRPLSVTPMFIQHDARATGLLRLLTLGWRVLVLVEFAVRHRLAQAATPLTGLYAGNPTRATTRPTAERLLAAFHEITLTIITTLETPQHYHLTPLTALQQRILSLLDFPETIYLQLTHQDAQPP